MKKIVAILLVLFVLVGCSSNSKDEKTPDTADKPSTEMRMLKVDAFSGGNGEQALTKLAEAFEKKYPEVDVQLRFEKELASVLSKENATGTYSDVVYFNLGQPSGYTEAQLNTGEVLEITDVYKNIADRMADSFENTSIGNYFGDGKQYLLPIKYTPTGFFYNTELVGEGKKYALPTTWEEMFALGEQAKADGVALFTYPTNGYFDNTILALMTAAGDSAFVANALKYGEKTWDSEIGRKVLDTIGKLVGKDSGYLFADTVANANAKDGFKQNQQAVVDGKVLFMPNGDWIVAEMKETTPAEFHWGLMPVPALEKDGNRVVASYTEQMFIPKQAKNIDDAKKFLEFIYSEEGSKIMVENGFVVPVTGVNELLDGYNKEFFGVYNEKDVIAAIGAFSPFDSASIPDVDFSALFYGPIDELATGSKTVDQWQADLVNLWKTLSEHPAK